MATLNVPIRIKRGDGPPTQLRQGELAFDQENTKLYIGSGTEVGGYAPNVVELTTPPVVLEQLSNISVGSGAADGDVLVYDGDTGDWVAQALAAASVAWGDITGKPTEFDPVAHKTSHATGGTDALSPSDIGAAAAAHSHAWGDITSGVPSEFTPASHTHGSITNDGKIGSTAGLPVVTGSAGAVTTLALGTAGQVLRVNAAADGVEFGTTAGESVGWADVTDKPTTFAPSAHKASHATGGADALSPSDIGAIPSTEKGANSGVATLDSGGKLNTAQLPNLAITSFLGNAANEAAMLALTGQEGDWAIRTDSGAVWIITGATPSSIGSWTQLSYPAAPVASVNGETGTVVLDHTDVGAAASSHTHSDATTSVAGFMSAADKTKLDGVASGATANTGTVTSVVGGTGLTGGNITATGTLAVSYGTTAGTACEGNDARLSDTRTPTDNTVSTAKLQDGAVTYAKIQDVSATDKILGRATAGAGDVEEITCTAAGRALLDDADAAAQRTTLGLGGASEKAVDFYAEASHAHGNITTAGAIGSTSGLPVKTGTSGVLEAGAFGTSAGEFAEGNHTHAWTDITSKPSDFTPSAHNHTVTLEMSGLIESPEAKTYVISPAIPAAITITNVKAKTSEGTVDIKLQDDGVDITNTTIGDVGTSVAEPATEPSATVAADSVLALVVSDLQTSPKNLAFTIHYTVASQNNA